MGRTLATAIAVSVPLLATGCGASSTPAAQVTVTQTVTSPETSGTSTGAQTTATSTGTTTSTATTPAMPACTASDLALVYEGSNGAAGSVAVYFAFKNTSHGACHTYGYPGVLFLDRSGAALPTDAQRTTHDLIGPTPVAPIVVGPGKLASFRIIASMIGSGEGCRNASGLQAIAPDDTATMRTTISGGVFECAKVTLSPLALGSPVPPGT